MAQTIQRSFTGGEITPSLRSRADLVKYTTGLGFCENMFIRSQGGAYSRPGFRFVGEIGDSNRRARLIPFAFNTDQTYVLVFEHLTMRVVRDGGFVLSGTTVFQIATPYTEDQLPRLGFTQDADVMTIVHPSHEVRTLSRTADDAWSLDVINYSPTISNPVWPLNEAPIEITEAYSKVDGIIRITTAVAHGYKTGDVVTMNVIIGNDLSELTGGHYAIEVESNIAFRVFDPNSLNWDATRDPLVSYLVDGDVRRSVAITAEGRGSGDFPKFYTYIVTAVDSDGIESLVSAPRKISAKSLSSTFGLRLEWVSVSGADYYRVYKDPSNETRTYGWIGDTDANSFVDYNTAPDTTDSPPTQREPLTGTGNYPATVSYYQQRQVFANTNESPQTVFMTQTGVYNSFRTSVPARADDAITFTIKGRQVNEIRHIISLDAMILLTSGGEWRVTEGQDQVLTPSTVGIRIQSYNGSSWVPPAVIDDTVVYVQEKGGRLRDIKYQFSDDKYSGNDLSIMAEHLFEGFEVKEMAYAAEPYGILWVVRNDGVLLGLTYQREHQVWAWHHHTTDGLFESVTVISEDGRDATYVSIKRTVNGVTKRYIERLEPRIVSSAADVFCVDSGLSYNGVAITTVSGLDHLEGKDVVAVADGNVVTGLTVVSGSVTLPRAASKIHVGLPYTPVMELLDIDVPSTTDTLKGKHVSVSSVIIEVEKTRGGWVGPISDDGTADMIEIKPRFDSDGYGPLPLKTFKQEVTIQPGWNKGGGIRIEQRAPMPMAVLSVIPDVDVSG